MNATLTPTLSQAASRPAATTLKGASQDTGLGEGGRAALGEHATINSVALT